MNTNVLWVAADSQPGLVAGAIAGQIRDVQQSDLQAIGMMATYQMLKAVIVAQMYLEAEDVNLTCSIRYVNGAIDGRERKAVRMAVRLASEPDTFLALAPV